MKQENNSNCQFTL